MRALIQRVSRARVDINGETAGETGKGLLIFLGVIDGDGEEEARLLAGKAVNLRIFGDAAGKMNLSLLDVGGSALVVSQFTLAADCRRGRRPSFIKSAPPQEAERLYEYFKSEVAAMGAADVQSGVFGADMQVSLVNDGPVTVILDTDELSSR